MLVTVKYCLVCFVCFKRITISTKNKELNAPTWGIKRRQDSDEAEEAERKIWKGRGVPRD